MHIWMAPDMCPILFFYKACLLYFKDLAFLYEFIWNEICIILVNWDKYGGN